MKFQSLLVMSAMPLMVLAGPGAFAADKPFPPADTGVVDAALTAKDWKALAGAMDGKAVSLPPEKADEAHDLLLSGMVSLALDGAAKDEIEVVARALLAMDPDDVAARKVLPEGLEGENSVDPGALSAGGNVDAGVGTTTSVAVPERRFPPSWRDALEKGDAAYLADLIAGSPPEGDLTAYGELRDRMEQVILDYVKPLPASNTEENRDAYTALAALVPEKKEYHAKSVYYRKRHEGAVVAKKRAQEAAKEAIIGKLKKKTDEFNGVVFYKHPEEPRYTNTRTYISAYIGVDGNNVYSRFKINYTGDRWIFIDKVTLNIDGQIIDLPPQEWVRDHISGDIWEVADMGVTLPIKGLMTRIANSKKTMIRFSGSERRADWTVKESDKKVLREILEAEMIMKEDKPKVTRRTKARN